MKGFAALMIVACSQTQQSAPCTDDAGAGIVVVRGGGCWRTYAIHCTDDTPPTYGSTVANVCGAGSVLWNTQKESTASCTIDVTCADDSNETHVVDWLPDTTPGCFRAEPQTILLCKGIALDAATD